jgi:hypothetical protein
MAKHLYCIIHIYVEHKRNSYDTLMQDKNSHKTTKLSNNQPEVTTSHAFETAIRKVKKDVEREHNSPISTVETKETS